MSLRPLPAKKIVNILNKIGFETVRQKGSHLILKLTREEFLKLLEEAQSRLEKDRRPSM